MSSVSPSEASPRGITGDGGLEARSDGATAEERRSPEPWAVRARRTRERVLRALKAAPWLCWVLHLVVLAIVARVAIVLSRPLAMANVEWDERYFVWTGWALLKGRTPYRDFHAFKPP